MSVDRLPPEKLRHTCDTELFSFTTTAELAPINAIIGQPRGTRAIEFGIGIRSEGYNIFVMGPEGSGRATALEHFLKERTSRQPVPDDWVYVNNFAAPHNPRAIEVAAGEGRVFQKRMRELIDCLKEDLPQAFDNEQYKESIEAIKQESEGRKRDLLGQVQKQAEAAGFALINTASGFAVAPAPNGQPLSAAQLRQLPTEERQALSTAQQQLESTLEETLFLIRELEMETRDRVRQLDREVAETAVSHHFRHLQASYADHEEILLYLQEVHDDVLDQLNDFAPPLDYDQPIDLSRYEVNLLVDNSETEGAPVIIERHPTYHNLFGRLEYEMYSGVVTTNFTNIKCGSLHRTNGGYLMMNARDLLRYPATWGALKRSLRANEISVQQESTVDGRVLAKSLSPEPIPLDVKIILIGSAEIYYTLYEMDEEFATLFKVRSDFDSEMHRDPNHVRQYAQFVASCCRKEGIRHFDRSAVTQIVEYGSRLVEHQKKLSTRFGALADLVREASYWAEQNGRNVVTAEDVNMALSERTYRANLYEEEIREEILEKTIFIATEGNVVGQVNGLSVLDTGDYTFGQPGRITARTFMGEDGIVHIERETDMSGPIHEKGVLTLTGYFGGMYAQRQPLSFSASITFEQNYFGVEGDSASSTELYALLSSLAELPIKQGIAVTGSVNQRGEVQPIGGVNEKVEGFFRVCAQRRLTGEQGVIIPASNVDNLMLHEDVVAAVAKGKFHIWPVQSVDEGVGLLMGVAAGVAGEDGDFPEGTLHHKVQQKLAQLARELKSFGDSSDE